MINKIKKGIPYFLAFIVSLIILLFFNYTDKYTFTPNEVYKVYLDGKSVGNIKSKEKLENYIDKDQKNIKKKYGAEKVYIPSGVDIQKVRTYEKKTYTEEEINKILKSKKPFTINSYIVTIKNKDESKPPIKINVLESKIFETAIKKVLNTFVNEEKLQDYENDIVPTIDKTGFYIENIYLNDNITIKNSRVSVEEEIFVDEKSMTKFLLFGEIKDDILYEVKDGDTIEQVAFDNKLGVEEFLVVNPDFRASTNLLYPGQQVKVGLIDPIIEVVTEEHRVSDQEIEFETKYEYDSSMTYGSRKTKTEGEIGTSRLTSKIKMVNGAMDSVVVVDSEIIKPPIDKIISIGTYSSHGGYIDDPSAYADGAWAWPTIRPYIISSGFSWRWGKFHEAIDIAGCGHGSPIYAANNGVVVTAIQKGSLGKHVVINHQNGYHTLYAHLNVINVSAGAIVKKGQRLGGMGKTGFATGTHLHFGVYKNGYPYRGGIPINPLNLYK